MIVGSVKPCGSVVSHIGNGLCNALITAKNTASKPKISRNQFNLFMIYFPFNLTGLVYKSSLLACITKGSRLIVPEAKQ